MGLKPAFRIRANSDDITGLLSDRLLQLDLTDEAGEHSDECTLTLADHDPARRIALPTYGAELAVAIGYEGALVEMGTFTVATVRISGPPRQVVIKAKAVPLVRAGAAGRSSTAPIYQEFQNQVTRSWPALTMTLGDLVAQIATEHGMQWSISRRLSAKELPQVDQVAESDQHLLTRVCRQFDALFKFANGKVVITARDAGESASGTPLPAVRLTPAKVSRYECNLDAKWDAPVVVVTWHDSDGAASREVRAGEGTAEVRLKHHYATQAEAEAAATAEVGRRSRGARKASFSLPGDATLAAEGRVTATGFGVGLDGSWLVKRVRHSLGRGFTSEVECEGWRAPT